MRQELRESGNHGTRCPGRRERQGIPTYLPGIVIVAATVLPYSQTTPQPENRGRYGSTGNRQ
jgi:hypothetical protein